MSHATELVPAFPLPSHLLRLLGVAVPIRFEFITARPANSRFTNDRWGRGERRNPDW